MKSLRYLAVILIATTIAACGGTDKKADANSEPDKTEKQAADKMKSSLMEVDLSEYNIMATIMIPDESKGKAEIEENAMGGVNIQVGDRYGIIINPFGLTKEEFKNDLMNNDVYEIELKEESDLHFLYKRTIVDSDIEPEFHFFMNKEINGELYEIKSMPDKGFSEGAQDQMYESAQTFTAKPMS